MGNDRTSGKHVLDLRFRKLNKYHPICSSHHIALISNAGSIRIGQIRSIGVCCSLGRRQTVQEDPGDDREREEGRGQAGVWWRETR